VQLCRPISIEPGNATIIWGQTADENRKSDELAMSELIFSFLGFLGVIGNQSLRISSVSSGFPMIYMKAAFPPVLGKKAYRYRTRLKLSCSLSSLKWDTLLYGHVLLPPAS
jgi:hypothetical protein